MSTYAEYREAAARFRRHSRQIAEEAATVPRWSAERIGLAGPAGDLHDDSILALRRLLDEAAALLHGLVAECERRAEVCRGYTIALWHWTQLHPTERVTTPRPVPPAAWVTAGVAW